MTIPRPPLPDPNDPVSPRNPFGRPRSPQATESEESQDSGSRGHMGDSGTKADRVSRGPRRPKRPADSTDILLSLPTDLSDRLESVLAYTYPHTGVKTKQQFIRAAIVRACAEHEARFNDGDRWPVVPKLKSP